MQGSLPAGWLAFTGRELNPLDRDEGFQITSSSLPGLFLAQRPQPCTGPDYRTAKKRGGELSSAERWCFVAKRCTKKASRCLSLSCYKTRVCRISRSE
jgi:hypothetical protein